MVIVALLFLFLLSGEIGGERRFWSDARFKVPRRHCFCKGVVAFHFFQPVDLGLSRYQSWDLDTSGRTGAMDEQEASCDT